jgi:hypothetical protein
MNPTELFHADGKSAGIWYCGKCRIVKRTETEAGACCLPVVCACGNPVKPYWTICEDCYSQNERVKEHKRFEAAEKLMPGQWNGPVVLGDDHYFDSVGDLLAEFSEDGFNGDGEELPEYVWTCDEDHFVRVDIEAVDTAYEGEAYDDFDPNDLKGREDLKAALAAYCEANKDVVSWKPNRKRCVVLKKSIS